MKIEYLSMDPPLIQVHDFVRDGMIESIKSRAHDRLFRSSVLGFQKGPALNAEIRRNLYRTSVNSWIFQEDFPELKLLHKKIEYLTDLNVVGINDSEALQVVAYSALGSHYEPHTDLVCFISFNSTKNVKISV